MFQDSLLAHRPAWLPDALCLLARHRFLTPRQLAGRLALERDDVSKTLTTLAVEGVLRELRATTLGVRDAASPAYALTAAGLSLAAVDDSGLRPRATRVLRSAFSLAHELLVNECALVLEALDARGELTLLSWQTARERIAEVAHVAERGRVVRVPLVADALAVVEVGGQRLGLLIEVDMGTVSSTTMRRKYLGYHSWWQDGGPVRRFGLPATRVVTIAPGGRRLERLRSLAIDAVDGRGSGLFWFLPHAALAIEEPSQLFEPHATIARADGEEPRPLFRP